MSTKYNKGDLVRVKRPGVEAVVHSVSLSASGAAVYGLRVKIPTDADRLGRARNNMHVDMYAEDKDLEFLLDVE